MYLCSREYGHILQILSVAISREDNDLAMDNICAALARIIMTNISAVPMDQVGVSLWYFYILLAGPVAFATVGNLELLSLKVRSWSFF